MTNVPAGHQIRIAVKTLRMPDAMVGVMGSMTKEEAREILLANNRTEGQIKKWEKQ